MLVSTLGPLELNCFTPSRYTTVLVAAGPKLLLPTTCTGELTVVFGGGEQMVTVPAGAVHPVLPPETVMFSEAFTHAPLYDCTTRKCVPVAIETFVSTLGPFDVYCSTLST